MSFTAFEYFISQCRDVCVCVMFCNIAKRDSEIYLKGKGQDTVRVQQQPTLEMKEFSLQVAVSTNTSGGELRTFTYGTFIIDGGVCSCIILGECTHRLCCICIMEILYPCLFFKMHLE